MKIITLQPIPRQEIVVTVDEVRYKIQILSAGDFMTYGIERDGVVIIENGARIVNGSPLLPYEYMQNGNFILEVPDDELPDYNNFLSTQTLYYASPDELEAYT